MSSNREWNDDQGIGDRVLLNATPPLSDIERQDKAEWATIVANLRSDVEREIVEHIRSMARKDPTVRCYEITRAIESGDYRRGK